MQQATKKRPVFLNGPVNGSPLLKPIIARLKTAAYTQTCYSRETRQTSTLNIKNACKLCQEGLHSQCIYIFSVFSLSHFFSLSLSQHTHTQSKGKARALLDIISFAFGLSARSNAMDFRLTFL